jgi:hypothetical protein
MNPDSLQYCGAYYSNSIVDQFKIFSTDTSDKGKAILELKNCFETFFLSTILSDDL